MLASRSETSTLAVAGVGDAGRRDHRSRLQL